MKSVILKNVKKFKKYQLIVDEDANNILLIGYKPFASVENKSINAHNLIKKTCKLGKSLYDSMKNEIWKNNTTRFDKALEIDDIIDKKDINYTPIHVKHLFKELVSIENLEETEFYKAICVWCQEFGMPLWTDRKQLDNTIPINNLIFISLSMFMLDRLWKTYYNHKRYIDEDKKDLDTFIKDKKEKDLECFMYYFKLGDSLPITFANILTLLERADQFHDYIIDSCNTIFDFKLKIYHKKVRQIKNHKTVFYNETIYESIMIAAWDIFYNDYLGNSGTNYPSSHCDCCKLEIDGKVHVTENKEHLCDNCYAERKKLLNKNRVSSHRNNQKETPNIS